MRIFSCPRSVEKFVILLAAQLLLAVPLFLAAQSAAAAEVAPETSSESQAQSAAFFYKNAQRAIQKKNYAEALAAIESGLEHSPAYLPFLGQKALALTRLGRHAEASGVIELALAAMPDNVDLNILAVENILAAGRSDPKAAESALAQRFKKAGRNALPQLTARLVENYAGADATLKAILRALDAADALDERERAVLKACLAGNPELAATLIKAGAAGLEASQPRAGLMAAFSFLAARGLQAANQSAKAVEMYDLSLTLGYDGEKLIGEWAEAYMKSGEPLMAAKLYESYWRDASRPQLWAVRAAEARRAAGQPGKAVDTLKKAVGVLKNDPFLQGQYLFYLHLAGAGGEARAYAKELENSREWLGLNYGNYLAALAIKNPEAITEARGALLESVRAITSVHPQDSVSYIVEALNLSAMVPEMPHQADLLREAGWRLWDEKKLQEAFIHWRDSAAVDPERNKAASANIIMLLLGAGMVPQAMELRALVFPDMPEFSLALMLMRSGQWAAAWPVLSAVEAGGDFTGWHALGLAYSGLKSGAPRPAVEAAARRLLAMGPPAKNISCDLPDRDSGIAVFTLDRKFYFSVLKDFFSELFRQGYTGIMDEALQSGQFKLVPPGEGAMMLADAAFDLASKDAVEEAAPLWRAAHKLSPDLPEVNMGMALLAKLAGDEAAYQSHMRLAAGGDALKMEYVKGRICLAEGRAAEAAAHFKRYLAARRDNYSAAYQLFNIYIGLREYGQARAIRSYFAKTGNQEAMLYLALCNQGLGYYKNAEKIYRSILRSRPGYARAVRGLAACLRAQDRMAEAEELLEKTGVEDPEVLTVLRHRAERALKDEEPELAEENALRYLEKAPDSVHMNDVYNLALRERHRLEKADIESFRRDKARFDKGLLDLRRYDPEQIEMLRRVSPGAAARMAPDDAPLAAAEEHAQSILARNSMQYNALDSLLNIALQREDFSKAARMSRDMAALFPYDPYLSLQSAVHMGAISRFGQALPLTEKMAARGPNAAAMAVCFVNISARPRQDACTPQDIEDHLAYFKKNYRFSSLREMTGIADAPGAGRAGQGRTGAETAREAARRPEPYEAGGARERFRWRRGPAPYKYGYAPVAAGARPSRAAVVEQSPGGWWEQMRQGLRGSEREQAALIPMLVVIGRCKPEELQAVDEALMRQGARAALLVGEESFMADGPGQYPDGAFLRRLAATGRWEFILTDGNERVVPIDASGRKAPFWGGRAWLGQRAESREEMRRRWAEAIAASKRRAVSQGINPLAWMYPGGDYGQLGLDAGDEARSAYAEAVRDNFLAAMVPTGTGYHVEGADPSRLPVRNLYFPLDAKALAAMPETHPTRLAVLEQAVLASWHGQFPRAERLFERSDALGLSPRDISYNRAANAFFDGDAAYANQLARAALALAPDDARAEILMERAERMLRPRISFTPRWWRDDAERDYSEYALTFSGHVSENLQLSATAAYLSWGYKGKRTDGQALGAGLRFYPFAQHWLDLNARVVAPAANGDAFGEFRALWRGAYAIDAFNINGTYRLLYSREGIETRESIKKGVYADRFSASTSMRILDWAVLEGEAYSIGRTDGNNSRGLSLGPGYILWDKPQIKLGYQFNTATSDRNPPEYYAPLDYVSHLGTVTARYEVFKDFSINGMFGLGSATSRYKDWRQVLRWQAGLNWTINDELSLEGGYQRLEMPDYALDQFTFGVQYVF